MMPGTTYTRTGPTRDAVGRLADLARFVWRETSDIQATIASGDGTTFDDAPAFTYSRLMDLRKAAEALASSLDGFTTADD